MERYTVGRGQAVLAWHGLKDGRLSGHDVATGYFMQGVGPEGEVGRTYSLPEDGTPPELCARGTHGSRSFLDMLSLTPGLTICRAAHWGRIEHNLTRLASEHRKVLGMVPAERTVALLLQALRGWVENIEEYYLGRGQATRAVRRYMAGVLAVVDDCLAMIGQDACPDRDALCLRCEGFIRGRRGKGIQAVGWPSVRAFLRHVVQACRWAGACPLGTGSAETHAVVGLYGAFSTLVSAVEDIGYWGHNRWAVEAVIGRQLSDMFLREMGVENDQVQS